VSRGERFQMFRLWVFRFGIPEDGGTRELITGLGSAVAWPTRVLLGIFILLVAIIVFVLETGSILPVNGWWLDELWSLWATDPSLSFADAFAHRIVNDTTPPLYYVALFWVRRLIADDQSAVVALNLGVMVVLFATMTAASRKSQKWSNGPLPRSQRFFAAALFYAT
jgi:hypothetical protein